MRTVIVVAALSIVQECARRLRPRRVVDGPGEHRLTDEFAQFFAWSQDGEAILVAGGSEMYLIRPEGTGTTPLKVPGAAHPLFPDRIA
jgi:hypothetical protein